MMTKKSEQPDEPEIIADMEAVEGDADFSEADEATYQKALKEARKAQKIQVRDAITGEVTEVEIGPLQMPLKRWSKLEKTAYHEAGHAVMHYLLGGETAELSIIPNEEENTLGHHLSTQSRFHKDMHPDVKITLEFLEAAEKEILKALAGDVTEKHLTRRYNHIGAASDYERAVELAMHLSGGDPRGASQCIGWLMDKAGLMLDAKWSSVQEVARALLEKKHLTGEEVAACIRKAEEDEGKVARIEALMASRRHEEAERLQAEFFAERES